VIRLAAQGEPGLNGGTAGDLLVSVRVAKHPYFRREGSNLLLDVPLGIVEATLGAKVEIPTLSEGTVVMSIPPGSSSGTKLRLKGKGIVDRRSGQRGDQFAVLKIVAPKELSDRAHELLNELKSVAPQNVRDGLW
jgi:curved DNA-binding protein